MPESKKSKPITLYEFKLNPTERGLRLNTIEYICVKETPCYYFCVSKFWQGMAGTIEEAKENHIKIYKIHKTSSHKAFTTKERAFTNFCYRKSTLAFVEKFLKNA